MGRVVQDREKIEAPDSHKPQMLSPWPNSRISDRIFMAKLILITLIVFKALDPFRRLMGRRNSGEFVSAALLGVFP